MALSTTPKQLKSSIGAGFIKIQRLRPVKQVATFTGTNIAMPDQVATGENEHAHTAYGKVIKSGLAANRTSCEPFPETTQKALGFPIPEGSWVVCRNSNVHRTAPNEDMLNTWDVLEHFPPEQRPLWAPPEA